MAIEVSNLLYPGTTRIGSETVLRKADIQASGLQGSRHLWLIHWWPDRASSSEYDRACGDTGTRGRLEATYRYELLTIPKAKKRV